MLEKPLEGIKVVELSTYVAAPGTARMLADMGAEVIKVEAMAGDQWRETGKKMLNVTDEENPVFDVYNTGKKSICLNIKTPEGLEVMMKLLSEADIFVTNVRAQSLKKLGLDKESLREKCPRLIYASVDGFGSKGPDAHSPGFDNISFWARSGFSLDIRYDTENAFPLPATSGIGDCVTGGFLLAGIMTALYKREKTGIGDAVNVSLYGAAIWVMSSMLLRAAPQYGETFPMDPNQGDPLTNIYEAADGEWCNISVRSYENDAEKMYALLGISEQVHALGKINAYTYWSYNQQMIPMIRDAFKKKTADQWMQEFRSIDLVIGKLPHMKDVLTDEQAWANGFVEELTNRNGVKSVLSVPPIHLDSYEKAPSQPAPLLGEQTDEILKACGYDDNAIAHMRKSGAAN